MLDGAAPVVVRDGRALDEREDRFLELDEAEVVVDAALEVVEVLGAAEVVVGAGAVVVAFGGGATTMIGGTFTLMDGRTGEGIAAGAPPPIGFGAGAAAVGSTLGPGA